MKLVPLFNNSVVDNDNSSKLLALENVNNLDFNKLKNYRKVNLNCNFSNSFLDRLKNLDKSCIIIFNDYKLLLSNNSYLLKTSNFYDGYKMIFSIRKSNFTTCIMNTRSKFDILKCLFDESKFFLDHKFIQNHFTNIVNILNILYHCDIEDKCSPLDKLTLKKDISLIELYIENKISITLDINNIRKIIKILSYLENESKINHFFNKIVEKLNTFEFEDSLLNEILNIIPHKITFNNFIHLSHLLKVIDINDKSKTLLDNLELPDSNEKSNELYSSVITRTNWLEELECGNLMGLLLNINPKEINKNAYNLDYIPINEITHTLIGLDQILEAYKMNETDDEFASVMSGYGVGEGNCILPLYINKYHWDFVKLYFDYNLGIIFNRNPLQYTSNHKNVYKNVLIKMINLTFSDDNYKSDKWINLLFSVLRTNYELFKDDNNFVSKFIKDTKFRVTSNLNNILIDYLFSDNKDDCINIIFEELIRRTFKSLYKNIDVLDSIYNFSINSALNYERNFNNINEIDLINLEQFNKWISELELNNIFSEKITLIYAIIKMKDIVHNNNFFNKFDKNCGILDEDNLNKIKEYILSKKIVPENCELLGLLNPKFSSHLNLTKDKIFSVNTFVNLKLVENENQLHSVFIQGILQRVDKCRKKALSNNKVQNPFFKNDIVKSVGLLIAQRFIKKSFNLESSHFNYFSVINSIEDELLELFIEIMIKKTISIKKHILNALCNITDISRRDLVVNMLK